MGQVSALSTRPLRIPPKLSLRGTQLAGWTPRGQSDPPKTGILFDEDVEIALPDRTVLRADLFRPAGMGPVPVLVAWASYIKDTERLGGGPFIDESGVVPFTLYSGYAVLRVQPRGTGRSGGTPPDDMLSPQEQRDAYDVIEWAAAQSWCDGSIGMTGMSQFAMAQMLIAANQPPSLKAIFPYKAMSDTYRHGFYKGGAAYTGALELFAAAEKAKPPRIAAWLRHALSHVLNTPRFAMETSDPRKTQTSIRRLMKRMPPGKDALDAYIRRLFDNSFDGAFWREQSPGSRVEDITVPVCIGTDFGAQGFHFFGAFDFWHRLKAPKYLFIGPPEYRFPWANYQREQVAWYDWQLKGINNGYADLPPVRYWLRGADCWESAQDWPLPAARSMLWYLASCNEGDAFSHRLTQEPLHDADSRSWLACSSEDYALPGFDTHAPQILRYQSPPCAEPTRLVGPVTLQLTLSATAIDTYVIARLSDIAPDGTRTKLAWGWLLASHRTIDFQRTNPSEIVHDHRAEAAIQLRPGVPTDLRFSLTPIANLFKAGHRIELEIASRPDLVASESGEGFDMFCWDPVPYPSRNSIHHGGGRPSTLEMAVLPDEVYDFEELHGNHGQ